MIRVAQIVYDCIPNAGSDPGIGWHSVVCASAEGFEVHAITKASNRRAIEATAPLPGVTWHYIDAPERFGPLKVGRSLGDTIHLSRWLPKARDLCTELAEADKIDLTHFVTFTAHWMPVPLAEVPVPHVFGPVGGGERSPAQLLDRPVDRASAGARNLFQTALTRTPTWNRLLKADRTIVLSASRATTERLRSRGVEVFETWRTGCLPNTLIAQTDAIEPDRNSGTTIVMSGRQLRWKGHDLAINAMPIVLQRHPDASLLILGSGPEHQNLVDEVAAAGLNEHIRFHDQVDRNVERAIIAGADCFLFPSRRDTGSTLVPLVQVMGVPIAAFATGALPEATGGHASLADPAAHESPAHALAFAILGALETDEAALQAARNHAIDRFGEENSRKALRRWYEAALAPR